MFRVTQRLPGLAASQIQDSIHITYGLQQKAAIHLTPYLCTKRAGRHKPSPRRDKPLTYEQSYKPDQIGVKKGWNSFNSSSLIDGLRKAETAQEDLFIRKFIYGAWPRLLCTEVIIKRRANMVILSFICIRLLTPTRIQFLIGFTEELLSNYLKSIVKLEIQTIEDSDELTFKYI